MRLHQTQCKCSYTSRCIWYLNNINNNNNNIIKGLTSWRIRVRMRDIQKIISIILNWEKQLLPIANGTFTTTGHCDIKNKVKHNVTTRITGT